MWSTKSTFGGFGNNNFGAKGNFLPTTSPFDELLKQVYTRFPEVQQPQAGQPQSSGQPIWAAQKEQFEKLYASSKNPLNLNIDVHVGYKQTLVTNLQSVPPID